jgi:hypothetical protein
MSKLAKNKKSQQMMPALRKLLVFMVVAIALIFFFTMVIRFFTQAEDKQACAMSVMTMFGAQLAGKAGTVGLDCYTQTVIFREDGVFKIGSDRKEYELEKTPKREFISVEQRIQNEKDKAARVIVGELLDCRDQFFEGKLNLFGEAFITVWSKTRCVKCSVIRFTEGWIEKNNVTPIDITAYLNKPENAKIKKSIGGDLSFIDKKGINQPLLVSPFFENAVMFKAIEQSDVGAFVTAIGAGCATGAGAGLVFAGVGAIPGGIAGCLGSFIGATIGEALSGDNFNSYFIIAPTQLVAGDCTTMY